MSFHPHAEMEIVTYVSSGRHHPRGQPGQPGRTEAGDVQVMSAGSGIRHAEYNREDVPTRIFRSGSSPASKEANFPPGAPSPSQGRAGLWTVRGIASWLAGDSEALLIRAQARQGATLKAGETVEYRLGTARHVSRACGRQGRGERGRGGATASPSPTRPL
ncbi:MAG: pirin family protein [Hyphomicrobiales bacterium]